jgi:hypothetical protein
MAKQNRTIVALASRLVTATDEAERLSDTLNAIKLEVAEFGPEDKRTLDAECIAYIATTRGLTIKPREKGAGKAYWCSMVIAGERDKDGKATNAYNRASVALNRARAVIFAVEEGHLVKKDGEWVAAKKTPAKGKDGADTKQTPEAVFAGLEKLAALTIKSGDKAQIKALKARTQAIFLMLASA